MNKGCQEIMEVLRPGLLMTIQDGGRPGWRRFGVPPGGAMDAHAATWANRLIDNRFSAPVLEMLIQGARLKMLKDAWVAATGADLECSIPMWRAVKMSKGNVISFSKNKCGVWCYLAVEGGFDSAEWFGSASVNLRAGIGRACALGEILVRNHAPPYALPHGLAGRFLSWKERRKYDNPPVFKVWPGPQWKLFSQDVRENFFKREWTISAESDRTGYRLAGKKLELQLPSMLSEAVLPGSIQIPPDGHPIVTFNDGPTVGGYPKIGLVDASQLSWFAQCAPGTKVRFQLIRDSPFARPA